MTLMLPRGSFPFSLPQQFAAEHLYCRLLRPGFGLCGGGTLVIYWRWSCLFSCQIFCCKPVTFDFVCQTLGMQAHVGSCHGLSVKMKRIGKKRGLKMWKLCRLSHHHHHQAQSDGPYRGSRSKWTFRNLPLQNWHLNEGNPRGPSFKGERYSKS